MSTVLNLSHGSWCVQSDGESNELDREAVYTEQFIGLINSKFICPRSDYVNELFLYYYLKYEELAEALPDVDRGRSTWNAKLSDKFILLRLAKFKRFAVGRTQYVTILVQALFSFTVCSLAGIVLSLLLPFFLLTKAGRKFSQLSSDLRRSRSVFFVRTRSGYFRMKSFINSQHGSVVLIDDVSKFDSVGDSVFSILRSSKFPVIYCKAFWYALRDFVLLSKDAKALIGSGSWLFLYSDYWARVPHKALYEACLEHLIASIPEDCEVFSSDKEDRFAILQTRCCSLKGLKLTCLPHGLEYAFRFPAGVCGQRFYCFSNEAKSVLESLYSSKKFLYSDSVLKKMLGVIDGEVRPSKSGICLFTEPRDQSVNFEIIDALLSFGADFCVKLHPLEDRMLYESKYPGLRFEENIEDALEWTISLSRKSTVLIESAHRNNLAISVLTNPKDRFYATNLFPSLSAESIIKVFNYEDLSTILATENVG